MKKADKETITKELFGIEPIMINSSLLTAQTRKRLYWCGKLINGKYEQVKIDQPKDKEIYLKDIVEEAVDEKYYVSEKALSTYTFNGKIKNLKDLTEKSSCLTATCHKGFGNVQNWKKCFDVKLARSIEGARISKKCKTSESPSNTSETDLLQSMESEYISVKIYDNCFNYKSKTLKNIIDDHIYEYGKTCDKETRIQT